MPRVSVIVPAYNAAAVIEGTLQSLREQTYGDWEAIVADDASTDRTLGIVEGLADPRIRAVRSDVNLGPAGARNLAAEHARGELVALLDADDAWLPAYLERMIAAYDAAPDVVLVGCDARLERDGVVLDHMYLSALPPYDPPTLDRLLRGNFIYVSALFARAAAEAAGWFSTELFGTEDHDLWIRLLEGGGHALVVDEPLAVYRVGEGSVSANLGRMAASYQRTLERALERDRLTRAQQRIVRSELRYYRAMEAVARARFDRDRPLGGRARGVARALPELARVAATRPDKWRAWAVALRRGRR
jgi:glycosyltransferase involved in cell wall biosynthesis